MGANLFGQEKNPIKNILTQEPYRLENKIRMHKIVLNFRMFKYI